MSSNSRSDLSDSDDDDINNPCKWKTAAELENQIQQNETKLKILPKESIDNKREKMIVVDPLFWFVKKKRKFIYNFSGEPLNIKGRFMKWNCCS